MVYSREVVTCRKQHWGVPPTVAWWDRDGFSFAGDSLIFLPSIEETTPNQHHYVQALLEFRAPSCRLNHVPCSVRRACVVAHEGPARLARCIKRDGTIKPVGPPPDGQRCARRPKVCYFGDQQCGPTIMYPAFRCLCNERVWQCGPASCPPQPNTPTLEPTPSPVTSFPQPTTEPISRPATSSNAPSSGGTFFPTGTLYPTGTSAPTATSAPSSQGKVVTPGTRRVDIKMKADGSGTMTFGGKTVKIKGLKGFDYRKDVTVRPGDTFNRRFSREYKVYMHWVVGPIQAPRGAFIHQGDPTTASAGCIKVKEAKEFVNFVRCNEKTRIVIDYPWKR